MRWQPQWSHSLDMAAERGGPTEFDLRCHDAALGLVDSKASCFHDKRRRGGGIYPRPPALSGASAGLIDYPGVSA